MEVGVVRDTGRRNMEVGVINWYRETYHFGSFSKVIPKK